MKVLYILSHFPQNSESYVDAEMAYVREQGVKVEVWSPGSGYGDPSEVPVHRGTLQETIKNFTPDVIHIHHMTTAFYYLNLLPKDRTTIRAHSFDWSDERAKQLESHPAVHRVFAFPHLAKRVIGIEPLPVAYDPKFYYRVDEKDRRSVVRVCAGLPTKRLEDFVRVGKRCYDVADFTLAMNMAPGKESIVDRIADFNRSLGGTVQILTNLSRSAVSELVRKAAVYMSTYDAQSHVFGMPISIAEAMATGAVVLARSGDPAVSEYMGVARLLYSTLEEAESIVRAALAFEDLEWRVAADTSCFSASRFRTDVVLPKLIAEWKRIEADHF